MDPIKMVSVVALTVITAFSMGLRNAYMDDGPTVHKEISTVAVVRPVVVYCGEAHYTCGLRPKIVDVDGNIIDAGDEEILKISDANVVQSGPVNLVYDLETQYRRDGTIYSQSRAIKK